ncbi:MAG TPA: L-seryl-tRNA(Sec) selenium transferase [Candidatus Deferrimicrobium sp.]|nr:L-seryl-tRNA(Sec) selenium transferase [Candidatus Deferrimicrobium sp.]
MDELRKSRLREIPQVNLIVNHPRVQELSAQIPLQRITEAVQTVLSSLRNNIVKAKDSGQLAQELDIGLIVEQVRTVVLTQFSPKLNKVINATGIVLHTNCGRSVLPKEVLDFVSQIAGGYSNLELDLSTGERGSRYVHVEELLCKLTGAEAALVVNNNAAAVLLVMRALAFGKEVIVSRGELVEVGGSFRIPEVLKSGGANLVEVGTTNKTWLRDFKNALNENTAMLLKVHTSNFKVVGFTQQVSSEELVGLAREVGLPVVEDLGSGSLEDLSKYGLSGEPTVQEVVATGVDIVTFSGDKLLGGPQTGIIVGKKKYIDTLKYNQLTRALRVDKLTLAALEGVLRIYLEARQNELPTLKMLTLSETELRDKAEKLARDLLFAVKSAAEVSVEQGFSQAGGGSLPTANLPTVLVAIQPTKTTVNQLEGYLRANDPPVLARIYKQKLLIDVRTLLPGDAEHLITLFKNWENS